MNMNATLRKAVEDSGMTRYAIAQATGINESVLSRFVAGGRTISLANADTLAEFLGYELMKTKGAKGTKPTRTKTTNTTPAKTTRRIKGGK
jgi:transcriptional regulator with XRE-family HTH domain